MPTKGDLIYGSHFNNQASSSPYIECQPANQDGKLSAHYQTGVWYGQYGFPGRVTASANVYLFDDDSYYLDIYRMNNGTWYLENTTYIPEANATTSIDIPVSHNTWDFYKIKIVLRVNGDGLTAGNYKETIKVYPYHGWTDQLSWYNTKKILRQNTMPTYQWIKSDPPTLSTTQSEQYDTSIKYQQFGGYYWA